VAGYPEAIGRQAKDFFAERAFLNTMPNHLALNNAE
jgi:hypothetical protein